MCAAPLTCNKSISFYFYFYSHIVALVFVFRLVRDVAENHGVVLFPGSRLCTMQILPLRPNELHSVKAVVTVLDYQESNYVSSEAVDKLWRV